MKNWLTLVGLFVFGTVCWAGNDAGTGDGGGGAQIEAQFRLRGYELIVKIASNPLANAICSSQILESTLDTTQIDVVPTLVNPVTGEPITELVDAWTAPNHIQLLQESWQNLIGIHASPYRVSQQVDVLILHELFRATGQCDDDQFSKSIRAYTILSQNARSTLSEMWIFKYRYFFNDYRNKGGISVQPGLPTIGACEHTLDALLGGAKTNCIALYGSNSDLYPTLFEDVTVTQVKSKLLYSASDTSTVYLQGRHDDLANQLKKVSPEHPAIVVHDIQHGIWSFLMQ